MYWTRRGWLRPVYELCDDNGRIGSLACRPGWKNEAVAVMRHATVCFRQQSWWKPDFEAADQTTNRVLATYAGSNWKCDGTFEIADNTFLLKRRSCGRITEVTDASGEMLFRIEKPGWLGKKHEVILAPSLTFDAQIELLLYFAWFVTATVEEADATAAVTAAVT